MFLPVVSIYCFAKYECNNDETKITEKLNSKEAIDDVVNKYTIALMQYYTKWTSKNPGKEYNDMIKAAVDNQMLAQNARPACADDKGGQGELLLL